MLCGQGIVAIWNGITEEGRADFYAWHVNEHMPERVGIPGFLRGRRYKALDAETRPEFFTLYELQSFEVSTGQDYQNRLNAPTPWTKRATAHFRDTSRGLARVISSIGPGSGGVLATIRFSVAGENNAARTALVDLSRDLVRLPMMAGAHLALSDDDASAIRTAETKHRTDNLAPPNWIVLLEACTAQALDEPIRRISASSIVQHPDIGRYAHEYTRLKTDWSPG